jgi:hypothetical protein
VFHEDGLAAAARADDRRRFSADEFQVDALKDFLRPEALMQIDYSYHWLRVI